MDDLFSPRVRLIFDSLDSIERRYDYAYSILEQNDGNVSRTASIIGVSRNLVKRARAYVKEKELPLLEQQPKKQVGRPPKLVASIKQYIIARTYAEPELAAADLKLEIITQFSVSICITVINEYRHSLKLKYGPKVPESKQTPESIQKRLNFANLHLQADTNWETTIFTDESWFELGVNRHYVWRRKGDYRPVVCTQHQAHPPKVMIWGGVGYGFKTKLVFIHGSLNADQYVDQVIFGSHIIDDADARFGVGGWTFQQDNAPCHRSAYTTEVIESQGIQILKDWPPYSADLNIIEIIWAIMKRRIEKRRPKTLPDLITVVQDVWDDLNYATINALVHSVKLRLTQLVRNGGSQVHTFEH